MSNYFITGANEGIGYFLVKSLLEKDNKVAVIDINTGNLDTLKIKYNDNLLIFKCDVRNQSEVKKAVDDTASQFKTIDIAIHNACKCTFETEKNTDIDTYREILDVNYFGALILSKCVLPYMTKQNSGEIIFTSSGVGVTGFMGISPYASSKGALESLAKCLRLEYAENNISFHIIHPPLTRTKSAQPLPVPDEFMASSEKVGTGLAKHIKSKRFIICHSLNQKIQTIGCYLFPIKMGTLLSKMTSKCTEKN